MASLHHRRLCIILSMKFMLLCIRHRRVDGGGNFCSRKFLVRFQRLYGFSLSLMKRKANEFCFCFNSEAPFAFFLFDASQARNSPWKFYYVNCSFIEASLVF